jgi:hypothetical protein
LASALSFNAFLLKPSQERTVYSESNQPQMPSNTLVVGRWSLVEVAFSLLLNLKRHVTARLFFSQVNAGASESILTPHLQFSSLLFFISPSLFLSRSTPSLRIEIPDYFS